MEILTADEIDFSAYLKETEPQQNVRPAHEYVTDLLERLKNPDKTKKLYLPWDKTRASFQFRSKEVTIWLGANGSGKCLITGMVAMSMLAQGEKVCIASFEMKPQTTIQRMLRQYCQTNPFSEAYQGGEGFDALSYLYNEFSGWSKDRLWLYDQQGTVNAEQVIAVGRYCAKELGITHFFIDSLMKCVRGEDDYNGQKEFVDELTSLARDNDMHIHLVHHIKKPPNEDHKPGKYDGKGSGAISDLADNVFSMWRNKAKENDIRAGVKTSANLAGPDALLINSKQRNGDDEPMIALWFDKDSTQYVGEQGASPLYMPLYPHYRA